MQDVALLQQTYRLLCVLVRYLRRLIFHTVFSSIKLAKRLNQLGIGTHQMVFGPRFTFRISFPTNVAMLLCNKLFKNVGPVVLTKPSRAAQLCFGLFIRA